MTGVWRFLVAGHDPGGEPEHSGGAGIIGALMGPQAYLGAWERFQGA